jgi:MoaA/NifB/PqqE/SkfB family radical SAM enzyme
MDEYKDGPKVLNLSFDRSCNLSCPSCRKDLAISTELESNNSIMENISKNFGNSVETMMMSGAGDLFASKVHRKFLIDFDREKFKKLSSIHIQTNALLLNKSMWNKMNKLNKLINSITISIDAATKETYEIVRRGGNWEILMENIKFISKLDCDLYFSFIVQDINYKEMESFYNLISDISPSSKIIFNKITNWGTYSEEEFKNKEIYNESHPEFNLFLSELNKIAFKDNVLKTNMNDIVEKYLKKLV